MKTEKLGGFQEKLPRICYILGGEDNPLKIGEKFEVQGEAGITYHVASDGIMKDQCDSDSESGIYTAINHPKKIIRSPQFSEDEITIMKAMKIMGLPLLSCDDFGNVWAHHDTFNGEKAVNIGKSLFRQITLKNCPFDMENYLEGLK